MTAFLRLNGITVPVASDSADVTPEDIGSTVRASDGTPLFNRRAVKHKWAGKTVITTAAEALAWLRLVTGKGHVLNWESNNHYTSKGLAPAVIGANFTIVAAGAKYGSYRANSASAAGNIGYWNVFGSTSPWTVALWKQNVTAGEGIYTHVVVRSDGAKWSNGARNDGLGTPYLLVSAGQMILGQAANNIYFDDVVALPYLVPTDWPTQMHAFGSAFGALPRLTADGLFIEGNTATTVKGNARSLRPVNIQAARDYHDFTFELLEV